MAIQKITADVISSDAITTASISDNAITAAKLAGTLDLTGKTITIATASSGDNDTSPASTAFVQQEISALVDSSPDALNTLNELAAALGDDANFSTTVTNNIALKAPLASPDFTGDATFDTDTLVVDATNNRVGIGASSPAYKLDLNGDMRFTTNSTLFWADTNVYDGRTGNDRYWVTGATERMRIDSSGNVGIGTTSPNSYAGQTALTINSSGVARLDLDVSNARQGYVLAESGYTGLFADSGNSLRLGAGGSEAMRITSDGNLKFIGQTTNFESPGFTYHTNNFLYLRGGSAGLILADDSSINTIQIADGSSGFIKFETGNGTERMRINSTGEVHITSAGAAISPTIKYGGATGDYAKLRLINRSGQGANKGGVLELGAITDDGVTRSDVFAALHGGKDNSTSGNKAGYLDFHTSNGAALDQRMRLTSNGELLMGDTTLRGSIQRGQIQVTQIDSNNAAGISCISGYDEIAGTFCLYSSGTASAMISVDPDQNRASSNFYIHIDGAQKAILDSAGNFTITGSYGSSDRELKENIVTLPSQLEKVKQLNPVSFDWIERAEDGSTESSIGFIAQEVEELYPNLIRTPSADADAEEGNTTQYKSLNYAVMVSILTKAIQEQQTIIDDLKSRIETLEG